MDEVKADWLTEAQAEASGIAEVGSEKEARLRLKSSVSVWCDNMGEFERVTKENLSSLRAAQSGPFGLWAARGSRPSAVWKTLHYSRRGK